MSWRIPQYVPLAEKFAGYDDIPDLLTVRFFEIDFRRYYDAITNQITWQYKPWPNAAWVTYHAMSVEDMVRNHTNMGKLVFSSMHNKVAADTLATRRFYKVERVDKASESPAKTGPNASGPVRAQLGRGTGE